ncbi:hypothetical protein C2G38_2169444 [Gigaspora rosea]|uniref:Uncharacterized protein n=1 Tax=Gigaspora rosea TaxID=44941 RepID=A0A397VNK2_9GLOM|nr:hypothetical protein C2G38_2169444 [Gigaspora rosea]
MKSVDEKIPPNAPMFDKSKYRYSTSNHALKNINMISNENIITSSTEITASTEIMASTEITSMLRSITFIIKLSLELDGKYFLQNQIISQVFVEQHTNIWIEIEDIEISFDNLFD